MKKPNNKFKKSKVKLISGSWKGRSIHFIEKDKLRPTKNIIKETLFNLLQHDIEDSICLDMFAGSGSLGFEAASRGAKSVYMIEKDSDIVRCLDEQKNILAAHNVEIIKADAMTYEINFLNKVDILFLDPPFSENLLGDILKKLVKSNELKRECLIYIEFPFNNKDTKLFDPPENWKLLKENKSGEVSYLLFKNNAL